MPRLRIDGDDLVVTLSALEQLAAFRFGDVRVPLSSITDVAVEPDAWAALRGIRAPGTGIPGVIAYGTRRHRGGRDFALVRGGHRPGLRIDLEAPAPYSRLVLTVADPQEQAKLVSRAQRGP